MTVKPILIYPNEILTTAAKPVESFNDDLAQLIRDMEDTLIKTKGVGLAANQVGSLQRVLLLNADYCREVDGAQHIPFSGIVALINPFVKVLTEATEVQREGCLSIPNVFMDVERATSVEVIYQDATGKEDSFVTHGGLWNAAVQHEIDHLDGVMFPDRLSPFQRRRAWKKLDKERTNLKDTINYPFII